MALFFKKKTDEPADQGKEPSGPLQFSPEKAEAFFSRARTVHETGSYEYAISTWLGGLRHSPMDMQAMEGLKASMNAFLGESGGKKGVSKETLSSISGRTDVDRYLIALMDWLQRPTEATLAVRAAELASKLNLHAPARWIAEHAFGAVMREKRPRKDLLVRLTDVFEAAESFEKACRCAEAAYRLDNTDAEMNNRARNLAARMTMKKGGFDQAGQEGGFRQSIRDAEKQRQLEEGDRIVKSDETADRVVLAAEQDFKSRPQDIPARLKYGRALIERGSPNDQELAYTLLMEGYQATKQFQFRQMAGDIRIKQGRRRLSEAKETLAADPDNQTLREKVAAAEKEVLSLEIAELQARAEAYPTDLSIKYELGRRFLEAGEVNEAIPLLQIAQDEPKNRANVMNMLGQAFMKLEYIGDAVEMFKQGLETRDLNADLEMDLRYGMLTAMQAKAEADRDLAVAEEADAVASAIMRKNFGYRDVRQRREALKKLVASIKSPAS